MLSRFRIALVAACLAFAAAAVDGVLYSSAAAQAIAVPGPVPLLTAIPAAIREPQPAANGGGVGASYVGSRSCQHATPRPTSAGRTRMANIIPDPKVNRASSLAIYHAESRHVQARGRCVVYGTKWKQRYFIRKGNDYYPANAQDVTNKVWRPYFLQPNTEWWVNHYPAAAGDNSTRPTGPLCDGCHSTNFDVKTKQVAEWNVRCERCHSPGSARSTAEPHEHHRSVPPRRVKRTTCIQCHSQGQPLANPIAEQMHDGRWVSHGRS
jgi:hypothetical protein